jgi:glyoxylase-like metal-dependent hydrolase (beta-lactamase superfamily II)
MDCQDSVSQVDTHIWRIANRTFASNSYICATGEPGACFLVDPGTDSEVIDETLQHLGLNPRQIFCTHGHFDHVGSAAIFQAKYDAPCYLNGKDLKTLRGANFLMMAFRIPFSLKQPIVEEAEGFSIILGDHQLSFIASPGHTPGSCLIQYGRAIFTGDTLFGYGVGLSKLPEGDSEQLKATLLALWDRIPGDVLILPGHGGCAPFASIRQDNRPLLHFLGLIESLDQER